MIRRESDTALIDKIGNSAGVRPFICYHDHPIDWWPAIRGCAVLSNGVDAIGIFEPTSYEHEIYEHFPDKRVWQVHTLFDVTCRGKRAIETGKEMLAWMIPDWADVAWGATPMNNPAARWFNRQCGAQVIGHDEYEAEGPVELFAFVRAE